MRIQTSAGTANVRFEYDKKLNPKKTTAIVEINGEVVARDTVKKSKEDPFDKEIGRRKALRKALNNSVLSDRDYRQFRSELWSAFLNRFQKVTTRSQMAV